MNMRKMHIINVVRTDFWVTCDPGGLIQAVCLSSYVDVIDSWDWEGEAVFRFRQRDVMLESLITSCPYLAIKIMLGCH